MANSTANVQIPSQDIAQAQNGWVVCAPATGPRRMIVSTQARDKAGKTHFGFTQPGPIAFINMDRGWEGVLEKFIAAGKTIIRKDFIIDPTARMNENKWDALWYELRASYYLAVSSGRFRSVFVDTGNAMWEAQRMEAFGKLTQVPPLKYQEVNAQFEALISTAYNYPVNVVIAHRMKQVYENDAAGRGQKTGAWEATGYKDMRYVVQVNVEQAWLDEENVPAMRIDTCRQQQRLRGAVLKGEMCNFPTLGMMVHGPETAADWADGSREVR